MQYAYQGYHNQNKALLFNQFLYLHVFVYHDDISQEQRVKTSIALFGFKDRLIATFADEYQCLWSTIHVITMRYSLIGTPQKVSARPSTALTQG